MMRTCALRGAAAAAVVVLCGIAWARQSPTQASLERATQLLREARAADVHSARARLTELVELLAAGEPTLDEPARVELLVQAGALAAELGDWRAAERMGRAALELRAAELPGDHADVLRARAALAKALHRLGRLQEARALCEQVLEARSRTASPGDLDLQIARSDLAGVLSSEGDLEGARALREQVVDVLTATLPDEHPMLQTARGNLAATLANLGDVRGARVLQERVVEALAKVQPDEHPELMRARSNLSNTLADLGELERARELRQKNLDVALRTLPDDHLDLQIYRDGMANSLTIAGDLHGARELFEKALEARIRALGSDHAHVQATRANLASTLKPLGETERARELEEEVLASQTRMFPDDHPSLQVTRSNLAATLYALGEITRARELQEKVLEVCSRTLPDDHPMMQTARGNLAETLRETGDLERALELSEERVEIESRLRGPEHPYVLSATLGLANTLYRLGDLARARAMFEGVLEVQQRALPDDHPTLQVTRHGLALTLEHLGDLQGARVLAEKVDETLSNTLPPEHRDVQSARSLVALLSRRLGDLESARALQEEILEAYERSSEDDDADLQGARANLASTLLLSGDHERARDLSAKVLEVFTRTRADDHPDVQRARALQAIALRELSDLSGARALQEKVVEAFERTLSADHVELQDARMNLAITIAAIGARQDEPERSESRRAFALARSAHAQGLRQSALAAVCSGSSREAEERVHALDAHLGSALSFAAGLGVFPPSDEWEEETFLVSESLRGVALESAELARAAEDDGEHAALRTRARDANATLAALVRSGAPADATAKARADVERAERELIQRAQTLGRGGTERAEPSLAALLERLGTESALVAFRHYSRTTLRPRGAIGGDAEASLCAFVLRRADGARPALRRIELGSAGRIETLVGAWRGALGIAADARGAAADPRDASATGEAHGVALRRAVIDPLLPSLDGVRRLVVLLDDVLQLVPLDALPQDDRSSLGDRWRIDVRSRLAELLRERETASSDGTLVALGAVDYGESATGAELSVAVLRGGAWSAGFVPLPATAREVEGIAGLRECGRPDSACALRNGSEATRESLFALAPKARWLHVATHGWFAPESMRSWSDVEPSPPGSARVDLVERAVGMNPMLLCGLALAGANEPMDATGRVSGLVTAQELSALDLSSCELAVLSACDTNVGRRRAGQGVASLQRALQMAGARSVITSLWKVPDEATKELMIEFYRRLWVRNEPKWQALWEAKRMLRDAKDARGIPKYSTRDWAAWVLTGAPD